MTTQIIHEYDGAGLHRLVVDDITGPWHVYRDPAVHRAGYMAFTDYFGERVIRFTAIPLRKYRVLTAESARNV